MFCGKCGTKLDDDAKFCGNCGTAILPLTPPPAANATFTPPVFNPPPPPKAEAPGLGGDAPGGGAPPAAGPSPGAQPGFDTNAAIGALPLSGARIAGIVERVKNILLTPKTEWPVIAGEPKTPMEIYFGYVAPLAAIGVIAAFIGSTMIGFGMPFVGRMRLGIGAGLVMAIITFATAFLSVFLVSFIIDMLAPNFGGQKNSLNALKAAAYAFTPGWVAGVLNIFPMLGIIAALAALYGLYLLYLGLPVLMRSPEDKSVGYTVVIIVCAIVVNLVIGALTGLVSGVAGLGAAGLATQTISRSGSDTDAAAVLSGIFGGKTDADKARMKDAMATLEMVGKQVEQTQKGAPAGGAAAGDPDVAAALTAVGTMLAGGRNVTLVDVDVLRETLPEILPGGMTRTALSAQSGGAAGIKVASVTGQYAAEGRGTVSIEIVDLGAMAGLANLAARFDPNVSKVNNDGYERTKVNSDGQVEHMKYDQRARSGQLDVVVANRFLVTARGNGVGDEMLYYGAAGVDQARLVAMASAAK